MRWLLSVVLILAVACGCGSKSGRQRAPVEGKVTLDGVAIERGSIAFTPAGQTQGMAAGATIENGQYRVAAADGPAVGMNRVEITAPRKTGRKVRGAMGDPGATMDETVEAVPAKYNKTSTLQREIKPGKNVLDFDLRTK